MPDEGPDKSPRSLDETARDLIELFSDPKLKYSPRRYWLYDPERQVFYRDPFSVEFEKAFDEALGIEHLDDDKDPRPPLPR